MYDLTLVVAEVEGQAEASYVGTSIYRFDLDSGGPDEIEMFVAYLRKYPGIAHGEQLAAVKVVSTD